MERSSRHERSLSKRDSRTKTRSRSPVKNRSLSPKKKPRTFSKYRRYAARSSSSSSSSSSTSSLQRRKSNEIGKVQSVVNVMKPKEAEEDDEDNKKSKIPKGTVVRTSKIKRVEGFRSSKNTSAEGQTRCRDYDVLGFCVLGDQCSYDHGEDPFVVTHIVPVKEIPCKSKLPGQGDYFPPHRLNRRQCAPAIGEYHPEHPGFGPGFGWPPIPPMRFQNGPWSREQTFLPHPMFSQEHSLVDLSFLEHQNVGTSTNLRPVLCNDDFGRHNRGNFDYRRLGKKRQENTSLVVKKIPVELNNIHDLNGYFLRFGKIMNIQINFENDPESALITFANKWDAKTACGCTDAVFNNRFIRVMWYKENKELGNNEAPLSEATATPAVKQPPSVLTPVKQTALVPYNGYKEDETFNESHVNDVIRPYEDTNWIWTANNTESTQADGENNVLSDLENQANKDLKTKRKKLIDDLRKRKQEMADKQIQEQKLLISKLETNKASMKPKDRQELMSIIKSLQQSIEALIKVNVEEVKNDNENILQEVFEKM